MAREFSVIVGIDAGKARRGAREFKAASNTVTRGSQRMERGLRSANRRAVAMITTLGRLRGVATVVFSGFLGVGGVTTVIRTLSQFETAISSVASLISAQNPKSLTATMSVLTERAREMGATTLFTATQAAEGMKFLTLAGFEARDVYLAIEPALNLAAAGMLDLGTAADIVSNIMAAFNVDAAETEMVADALAFTSARTNTNIQQLGEAMKFVGPVAGTLGVNVQETAVALGILGNSGLQASLAGTSLRRVMSGLLNPSREAAEVLAGMGLTSGELVNILQGGGETGKGLVDLVNTLADAGIGAAEAFTLFGQRGAPGLLSLVTQRDKLALLTGELKDIEGTVKRMADILADNIGGDARIAVSALTEAILKLGDSGLGDWLRSVTQSFTGFIRALAGIPTNMDSATDAMKRGIKWGELFMDNLSKVAHVAKGLAAVLTARLLVALTRSFAAMGANGAAAIGRFVAAMATGTVATNAMTFAVNLLKAALITTGVGALLVGAGYLVEWAMGADESAEATKTFSDRIDEMGKRAEEASVRFNMLNGARRELAFREQSDLVRESAQEVDNLRMQIEKVTAAQANLSQVEADAAETKASTLQTVQALGMANAQYGVALQTQLPYLEQNQEAQEKLKDTQALANEDLLKLQADLDTAVDTWKSYATELQLMTLVNQGFAKTTDEAAKKLAELNEVKEDAEALTKRLTGFTASELETLAKLVAKYDTAGKSIREMTNELDDLTMLVGASDAALAAAETTAWGVARAIEELTFRIKKQKLELSSAEKATVDWAWKLEELRAGTDKVAQANVAYRKEIVELVRQHAISGASADQLREALKLLKEQHEENIKKLEETCEKNKEVRECTDDSTKRIQQLWEQAMRNIQDAFADFFRNGLSDFDDFADSLLDAFKDMIANMLAAWFTSGIMNIFQGNAFGAGGNNLFGNIASAFGGGGGGASGASGGGNMISGLTGMWKGAQTFFKEAAFFLGEFAGGFSGFFTGVGGGTSAATFAGAGNWAAAGGSAAAAGLTGMASGMVVNSALGERGDPAVTTALTAVGGIIGSIIPGLGTIVGALIGGAVGGFVSNLIGGAKKLESATLEFAGTIDGVNAVVETVVSKQRSFFRGRKWTTTREDIDTTEVDDALNQIAMIIEQTAGLLGVSADALNDFSFSKEINVKGKSQEELEKIMGDLINELITGLLTTFVDNTEGLSDRLRINLSLFTGNAEEFLAAFQMLAAIDVTSAIDPVEAVQNAIMEQNKTATQSYEDLKASYRELIEGYDGSLESLQALTEATIIFKEVQTQLAAALITAGEEISATFQGSAQSIREQLMTEEELYALRRSQIDDLVEQAMNTTDPAELQRLADQINTLGLDAWNLLDEDQKAALGEEFVQFFEGLDELFGGQIAEGLQGLSDDASAIDQEVADSMTAAAQSIIDANAEAERAWREMQQWIIDERERRRYSGRGEVMP